MMISVHVIITLLFYYISENEWILIDYFYESALSNFCISLVRKLNQNFIFNFTF